jgi:NAD(P)-dependent dehydrogenase (short-subunit alcohol dehydrogenase family)
MKRNSVVIGGTRGLGRELVKIFSEAGHNVSVLGRREPPELDRKLTGVRYWTVDLLKQDAVASVLKEILQTTGHINDLVFLQRNREAGDDWTLELQITLTSTKQIIDALRENFAPDADNAIVMVSSVFARYVGEGQPLSYHVAKAGMEQMVRYYAVALGRQRIRVNGVTPFTFLKAESKQFYLDKKSLMDLYSKIIPLGRMATTEEIAQVIAFLCSSKASFITGQNLLVDGGLSLVWQETLARQLAPVT